MKIDFAQTLRDLDGKPIKKGKIDMSLASICVDALLSLDPKNTANIDGKEKVVRYELAKRIHKGGVVDLTTDEISKIKKLVGKLYFPIIVGQAFMMLENKSDELAEETSGPEKEKKISEVADGSKS